MTTFNYTNILTQAVDELSESQSYKGLFHQHKDGDPLPSAKSLYKIVVGSINSIFYFLHKAAEPFNCLEQDNLA